MKKIIILLIIINISIFVTFSYLSRDDDYSVEKKLWKLNLDVYEIAKDPKAVPPEQFDNLISRTRKVINKYPDSKIILKPMLDIPRLYVLQEKYDEARKEYQIVFEKYSKNNEISAGVFSSIGRTYEYQENWEEAEKVYQEVIQKYPHTKIGLNMPLYIAYHYRGENNYAKTMESFQFAQKHYQQLVKEYRDTILGFSAYHNLARVYLDQKRWEEALRTYGEIIEYYAVSNKIPPTRTQGIVKLMNTISAHRMKNFEVIREIYSKIADAHADHPMSNYLKKVVSSLKELEEKAAEAKSEKQ